jgi:hypothetical protein
MFPQAMKGERFNCAGADESLVIVSVSDSAVAGASCVIETAGRCSLDGRLFSSVGRFEGGWLSLTIVVAVSFRGDWTLKGTDN